MNFNILTVRSIIIKDLIHKSDFINGYLICV